MNIFQTFNIPSAFVTLAQKIADSSPFRGDAGMFRAAIDGVAFTSTGIIDDQSPMVRGREAMKEALADTTVTEAEIDEFWDLLDITDENPFTRIDAMKGEVGSSLSAVAWVAPLGAEGLYPFGAVVKHVGKTWVSLQDSNPFEPGVASWRVTWGTATDTPPDWIQPTGSTDYYPLGARVTHNGSVWISTTPTNVWEPGVFGWDEDEPEAPTAEPWSAGGGTGTAGSYNLDDEVTHPNAQDDNNIWLFRSKIPANTTEPGTDGAFHRWWEPIRPI